MLYNRLTDDDSKLPDTKFYGNYRGIVRSNSDPSKNGQVQVQVYPMFEGVTTSALPWAIPADPSMGSSSNIPTVGTWVWVFFEEGDWRYPVYWAAAPAKGDIPADAATNYPNRKIYKTPNGIEVLMDDTPGSLTYTVKMTSGQLNLITSGTTVNIDSSGNVNITLAGGATFNIGGSSDALALVSKLIAAFNAHTHSGVTSGIAVSGTPVTPWTASTVQSAVSKTGS